QVLQSQDELDGTAGAVEVDVEEHVPGELQVGPGPDFFVAGLEGHYFTRRAEQPTHVRAGHPDLHFGEVRFGQHLVDATHDSVRANGNHEFLDAGAATRIFPDLG